MTDLEKMGFWAKEASYSLATSSEKERNTVLQTIAASLRSHCGEILSVNAKDLRAAAEKGIQGAFIERMTLNEKRVEDMAASLEQVVALADPLGKIQEGWVRPNGLVIEKRSVPLGVIGIIFESRPNVTVDAAGLCIKSGNACILRGGSETLQTNAYLCDLMEEACLSSGWPKGCVQLVRDPSREVAREMMQLSAYLDVLIPRGGAGLIRSVKENARIPVIETGTGNCHTYVDRKCEDFPGAIEILLNAKVQRPSVCNAMETLLVDEAIAPAFLPSCLAAMQKAGVEIRADQETKALVPWVNLATEEDYDTEYNDLILAVKIVENLNQAVAHINRHGTRHSEAILTNDYKRARYFQDHVDAACVYVNASTRFTDGNEFGFGAEIGISNQKLHARGPMGLKEMTTYKYLINGDGQIRT